MFTELSSDLISSGTRTRKRRKSSFSCSPPYMGLTRLVCCDSSIDKIELRDKFLKSTKQDNRACTRIAVQSHTWWTENEPKTICRCLTYLIWKSRNGWRSQRRVSHSLTQTWWRVGYRRTLQEKERFSHSTCPPADRSHPRHPSLLHSRIYREREREKKSRKEKDIISSVILLHNYNYTEMDPVIDSYLMTSIPGTGSGSSVTLNVINRLLKTNDWMNYSCV